MHDRMRSRGIRGVLTLVAATLALVLTACEKPDFSGVRFKPPEVDPTAHQTSFRAYLFLRHRQEVVWGNEFLFHSRSLPEKELAPLKGVEVLFDEGARLKTDGAGLIAVNSIGEGFHTLRFDYEGVDHALPFRVRARHMTLLVMELADQESLAASAYIIPHTFLTVPHFKRLLSFHQATQKLLPIYESARRGQSIERWERLLADDYSDTSGGKSDFLKALKVRAAADRSIRVLGSTSELGESAGSVTVRLARGGRPDFVRLELKAGDKGAWRIASIDH